MNRADEAFQEDAAVAYDAGPWPGTFQKAVHSICRNQYLI